MIKTIINIVLLLAALGLLFLLGYGVYEPIQFQDEWSNREADVRDKLIDIRTAQNAFRGLVGEYANTMDTLTEVLTTSEFKITKVFGDPDATDPNEKVRFEDAFVNSTDSMFNAYKLKLSDSNLEGDALRAAKKEKLTAFLNDLRYVPNSDNKEFKIDAFMIDYQKTKVPVLQVSTLVSDYMGKYASNRFKRYDPSYDPTSSLKFGDLTKPSTAGNWRQQTKEDDE